MLKSLPGTIVLQGAQSVGRPESLGRFSTKPTCLYGVFPWSRNKYKVGIKFQCPIKISTD